MKSSSPSKAVAYFLLVGVAMLIIQVILGGITRLTGSGLSITEWNVVTGIVPPLNEQQWAEEFDKYKASPQYHLLNSDFTISNFKSIFFWEWFHRFWARLVGVVFVVGFVYLIYKRELKNELIRPLFILFLLGGLQGAIGWIMVVSGLTGDAIYVNPVRLMVHFIFGLGLICYAFWVALQLLIPEDQLVVDKPIRRMTFILLICLFFQLCYGALMAGYKAANVAPTWPTINGDWYPRSMFINKPLLINFVDNKITVQIMHRFFAYLIFFLTIAWTFRAYKLVASRTFRQARWLPMVLVFLQVVLGICALLSSTGIIANQWVLFDWIALFHQLVGMLLLLTMIFMLFLLRKQGVRL
ncbi:MAG: heme A synthase [Bacteroidetes bacterium]|nr:MAG: heme A synthase [Bacteroidota bacterium]